MALFPRKYGKTAASDAIEKMSEVGKEVYRDAMLGGIGSVNDPAFIDHFTRAMNQISRTHIASNTTAAVNMPNPYTHMPSPMAMIAMRLRLPEGHKFNVDHIHAFLDKEKAFVFIVNKGQSVTIEDEVDLFPSDALITQLRLIIT